jgi:hypothetical protein
VPLTVIQPNEAGIADLYPTRLTLIRPDQHVAWRANDWSHAGEGLFEKITGRAHSVA